jgi:hypothetical protein
MTLKHVAGILVVAMVSLMPMGCKKKPKDKTAAKGPKADMTGAESMRPVAMDAMGAMDAMRAAAMGPKAGMTTLSLKMEKPGGMIVIPRGKNPLAGVDISKEFGEGWFKKGDPPGMNQPATMTATAPATMTPAAPVTMTPGMAPAMAPPGMSPAAMTPAAMTPAAMTPATPAAKTKPQPLPYTRYVHPDKSFAFRHPTGWTPKVKVGKVEGIPTFIIQVRKDIAQTGPGELGALAFVLPKKAPDSRATCQKMIAIVKKTTPSLQAGPLKPVQKTGLLMFQATSVENGKKQVSLAFCGTAHGRIMILSYFTVGQSFGNYNYGYQLGLALYTFTSDLLKK